VGELCTACGKGELKELVPGIRQCTVCRKIFKQELKTKEIKTELGNILDGDAFNGASGLSPKWEIADKGITINREENKSWFAVLICHTPNFPDKKYIRLSWWKKAINEHAGMFKIEEEEELDNLILALERIDRNFNDNFEPTGNVDESPITGREDEADTLKFDEKKRLCLSCGYKMKLSKNHRYYECERCGDIVVVLDGKPIIDYPTVKLPLNFSSNFPVNFYLPYYGISIKILMGEWKAIVIVYAKENPDKKWLRFYWWNRDLQNYMISEYSMGVMQALKWEPRKGTLSPNIYEKKELKPLIVALKKLGEIWKQERKKVKK
jgi:ribosomal protein L37AE/L43A